MIGPAVIGLTSGASVTTSTVAEVAWTFVTVPEESHTTLAPLLLASKFVPLMINCVALTVIWLVFLLIVGVEEAVATLATWTSSLVVVAVLSVA